MNTALVGYINNVEFIRDQKYASVNQDESTNIISTIISINAGQYLSFRAIRAMAGSHTIFVQGGYVSVKRIA